jgi:hypothetical protein
MSNYDDFVIGTGNSEHPYNRPPMEDEIFESDNLQDCLDYAKLANDFEPMENAVYKQETIIEKSISEIEFCIDILQKNSLAKNRLLKVKHLLMSNQMKRYE